MAQIFTAHQAPERWHLTFARADHLPQLLIADLGMKLDTGEVSRWFHEAEALHPSTVRAMTTGAGTLKNTPASPERRLISRLAADPQQTAAHQKSQRTSDGASLH